MTNSPERPISSSVRLISAEYLPREFKDLQELSESSSERNPFFEPFFLEPLLELDTLAASTSFLLISHPERGLVGLVPFSKKHAIRGLFLPHVEVLSHRHCFYRSPLIRDGFGDFVCSELLAWLGGQRFCLCFLFSRVDLNSQFVRSLLKTSKRFHRAVHFLDIFERATTSQLLPFDRYLKEGLNKKQSKEARRKLRRLQEVGKISVETLTPESDLGQWCSEFLEIERSGWKGATGSALGDQVHEERFFRSVCERALAEERLVMTRLRVDGKTIALRCGFIANRILFSFKTAYNEEYSYCSPGYLLELFALEELSRDQRISSIDSCTDPNSQLFERIYNERKMVGTVCISNGPILGNTSVAVLRLGHLLRQHLPGSQKEPRISNFITRLVSLN